MNNMDLWNSLKQPPTTALKKIKGGRLSGMTDINPQWRYEALTEQLGPCGFGWTYEIVRCWSEDGADGQKFAFAEVKLLIKLDGEWSEPFSGIGGSMLVAKESRGLHSSDEGYKMAVTDALSVAMKMLGVAADIYAGKFDGSKYLRETKPEPDNNGFISKDQAKKITKLIEEAKANVKNVLNFAEAETVDTITTRDFPIIIAKLEKQKIAIAREPGSDDS